MVEALDGLGARLEYHGIYEQMALKLTWEEFQRLCGEEKLEEEQPERRALGNPMMPIYFDEHGRRVQSLKLKSA